MTVERKLAGILLPIFDYRGNSKYYENLTNWMNTLRINYVWFMVLISAISWRSVLLVEETGVHREIYRPITSH